MLSRHDGYCKSCATRIEVGQEIEKFLGRWTHAACKAAEIARRTAAGRRLEIPTQGRPEGRHKASSRLTDRRSLKNLRKRSA